MVRQQALAQQAARGLEGRREPHRARSSDSPSPLCFAEWKAKTGGSGLLFRPTSKAPRAARFIDLETLGRHLRTALDACKLPRLTWYSCTRHTFASQFVINGGSIERLRLILGHSSVTTTERYAHLSADHFTAKDLSAVSVDLSKPAGAVLPFGSKIGHARRRGRRRGSRRLTLQSG